MTYLKELKTVKNLSLSLFSSLSELISRDHSLIYSICHKMCISITQKVVFSSGGVPQETGKIFVSEISVTHQ